MAEIGTGTVLTVVGMLVVFATLSVLGVIIAILVRWLKSEWPPGKPEAAETGRATCGLEPHLVAVLTAAATAVTLKPVRLTQIKPLDGGGHGSAPA